MTTATLTRRIHLLSTWLAGWDTDYEAYRTDPVEADLHEIGHVVDFFGSLTKALRARDEHGMSFGVEELSDELRKRSHAASDHNECMSIAIAFEVSRRIGHSLDERAVAYEANLIRRPGRVEIHRRIALMQRHVPTQRMVDEITRYLERDQ